MPPLYFTVLFVIAVLAMVGTKLWLASRQIRFVAAHRVSVPQQSKVMGLGRKVMGPG